MNNYHTAQNIIIELNSILKKKLNAFNHYLWYFKVIFTGGFKGLSLDCSRVICSTVVIPIKIYQDPKSAIFSK